MPTPLRSSGVRGRPRVLPACAIVLGGCASLAGPPPSALGIAALVGEVDLAALPAGRSVSATLGDVAVAASVSLIDPGAGNTVKTALTDGSGNFVISFGPTFAPASGSLYFLEAVKGLGGNAVGRNAARLRTLARWTGTSWASLTAGGVKLGTATTALAAIQALKANLAADKQVSAASLVGSLVAGGTYTPVANATAAEFDQVKTLVAGLLAGDEDPLANLGYNGAATSFYRKILANLAPDDTGDPTRHHDYVVTKGGVQSTFVWIPVFTAYQLIVPANCGGSNTTKPVGYWVATQPSTGTENTDWAREQFGGFYAGKYEASRSDATPSDPTTGAGATAGSSGTLKVARYCVPWANMNWDNSAQACLAYDAHAHLMRDDEWTALAVWATIIGVTVYGNNAEGSSSTFYPVAKDVDSPDVRFVDDPTYSWGSATNDRSLTGSATSSLWAGNANLTTHTGTTAGVHDLNGNVWEWTETVGAAVTSGNYVLADLILPIAVPSGGISALSTDPRLRRLGLAGATTGGNDYLGGDDLNKNTAVSGKAIRGGDWPAGTGAGLWKIAIDNVRSNAWSASGFRPALRY
ncbi:MAG: hypothetical protein FJZ01_26055 [Candidatus Sericytochromatia bacterium]|nr:hypothetical protein [Candidatus Tanganyikabacteria bacterium]